MIKQEKLYDGWNFIKLGEVAEIVMGQSPPSSTYNKENSGLPFFQGKTEFGRRHPKIKMYCSHPKKTARKNDLLMSVRAPVGPVNIANIDCCIGRGLCAIQSSDKLDFMYLYHFLKANEVKISSKGIGSTFTAINKKTIHELEISLPPLQTQKKIVSILEKAERLKEWRNEADELTDEFLKSTFLEMFGDPVTNPKGWGADNLGTIADVSSGLTVNGQRSAKKDNLFPYLRVANVYRNKIDLTEIKYIHISDSENERFLLKKNDILIVEGHGNIEEIGRAAIWNEEIPICFHQNHIIKVRLDEKYTHPHFLSFYLNSYGNHGYFSTQSSTTSGLNTISTNKVRKAKILLPPIELQQKFASIVQQVEQLREHQSQSRQHIDDLFNVLMQKAFKGELV